jgi:hypothetical protein
MPSTPETAFELFCSENQGADKRSWEALPDYEKAVFEHKSSLLFAQYQKNYDAVLQESSRLWTKHDSIRLLGDMEKRVVLKRISPYRVYKRETAASIKAEFPLMSNEERS